MSHLDQDQIEEFRGALEAERDSLEEELAAHGRVQGESGEWEGASMTEGEEAEPGDIAENIEELSTNVPLVAELETRFEDVEEAMERMDNGTYGLCEECGKEIDVDRLEADPAARTCKAHAQ